VGRSPERRVRRVVRLRPDAVVVVVGGGGVVVVGVVV